MAGVATAGTDCQVALAFPIVWVQSPALKNLVHWALIVCQSPVKNRNIARISRTNPQLARVDPVDSPKLMVIAITLGYQIFLSDPRHTHNTFPPFCGKAK
jgi:hypothetical protein